MRALLGLGILAMLAAAPAAKADPMIAVRSDVPVAATLDRMAEAATANGFTIVARVDHAAAAARVGLTLRPTAVLVFGKAQGGTPVMQCDQRAGIDLPLKALAWQDEAGQVWLGMIDPAELKARYGMGDSCDRPIAAMQAAVHALLGAASAPR